MRQAVLAVLLCVILCGCATMRYPTCYKVEGQEFKQFKDLDDEKALKVVALIFNVKPETYEDGIARSIALEQYLGLLAKRNSKYIKDSGIFDTKYDKVKLSAMGNEDLERLYDTLAPKAAHFYIDAAPELTETQNAQRIVYVTAVNAVCKELKRRDNVAKAVDVASQLLAGALSIAFAMI